MIRLSHMHRLANYLRVMNMIWLSLGGLGSLVTIYSQPTLS